MKIIVNNIAASTGGAMSILKDFYSYIKENDTNHEWVFLLSDNYIEETENIKIIILPDIKKNWSNKLKFDFFSGRKIIKRLSPDVVFSMQNIITFGLKIPQVVYIHQSIPFQNTKNFSVFKSSERIFAIYQYLIGSIIKYSAKKADKIIVQTKWMKKAVCDGSEINENKVINILPEVQDFSSYKKTNVFNPLSFFYPSSEAVYKNNDCIYKACKILSSLTVNDFNIKLTLDGDSKYKNIAFIGKIPRKELLEEYNKSTLIFPSYIETFGLPLAEAKQMGTIILASDCDFSREVLNGYENAYFFDPFKSEELAMLMKKVIDGKIIRREKVYENLNNKKSSWEEIIKEVVNC